MNLYLYKISYTWRKNGMHAVTVYVTWVWSSIFSGLGKILHRTFCGFSSLEEPNNNKRCWWKTKFDFWRRKNRKTSRIYQENLVKILTFYQLVKFHTDNYSVSGGQIRRENCHVFVESWIQPHNVSKVGKLVIEFLLQVIGLRFFVVSRLFWNGNCKWLNNRMLYVILHLSFYW